MNKLKGIPVFDIGLQKYLGQIIDMRFTTNRDGEIIYFFDLGIVEYYVMAQNGNIYPIMINGMPTSFTYMIGRLIKPLQFYERKIPIGAEIDVPQRNIFNLKEVIEGKHSILLIDTGKVVPDLESIIQGLRNIDLLSNYKKQILIMEEKYLTACEIKNEYKWRFEKERELRMKLENKLEDYKEKLIKIESIILDLEDSIYRQEKEIKRLVSHLDVSEELKSRLGMLINDVISQITILKNQVERINKELESEEKENKEEENEEKSK